jgi:hypothetical protein
MFDERMGVGLWLGAAEETDFVMRALLHGASIRACPAARVHHPVKVLGVKTYGEKMELRRRARATGALYVKHGLPLSVILRGMLAPVARPVFSGAAFEGMVVGLTVVLGRIEGMMGRNVSIRKSLAAEVFQDNLTDYQVDMPLPGKRYE